MTPPRPDGTGARPVRPGRGRGVGRRPRDRHPHRRRRAAPAGPPRRSGRTRTGAPPVARRAGPHPTASNAPSRSARSTGTPDQLLVGVTVPGGHPLTAVVLVDNELGAFAAEGYRPAVPAGRRWSRCCSRTPAPTSAYGTSPPRTHAPASKQPSTSWISARGPVGTRSWGDSRPLVEWHAGLVATGGWRGRRPARIADGRTRRDRRTLPRQPVRAGVDGRRASAAGRRGRARRAARNGIGDPLVWSPGNVQAARSSALAPRIRHTPALDRAPELLRDLIRVRARGTRPTTRTHRRRAGRGRRRRQRLPRCRAGAGRGRGHLITTRCRWR